MTMSDLEVGQHGRVVGYRPHDESLLQRLLEMGVSRGVRVKLVRVAPLGDPLEIALRGYQLSVRRAEARMIEIEPTA